MNLLAAVMALVTFIAMVVNERWRGGMPDTWLRCQCATFLGGAFFLIFLPVARLLITLGFTLLVISFLLGLVGFARLLCRPNVRGFTKPLAPGMKG